MSLETRICTKCLKDHPIGCFRVEKRTKIGLTTTCKFCERAYQKEHRRKPAVSSSRREYMKQRDQHHKNRHENDPTSFDSEKTCSACRITKPCSEFNLALKSRGGFASHCRPCSREFARAYTNRLKAQVFDKLGWQCKRCEFKDIRALQIDHVFGGGNREHKALKNANKFLKTVIADTTGAYQILCANCNWIKRYEKDENPTYEKQRELSAAGETCNDAATSPTRSSPTLNSSASNP